jgi:hypothetical protein
MILRIIKLHEIIREKVYWYTERKLLFYIRNNQRYLCVNIDFQKTENGRSSRSLSNIPERFFALHRNNFFNFWSFGKIKKAIESQEYLQDAHVKAISLTYIFSP